MRIIAGAAKGRRLQGPPGRGTRPMTDRAREGVFSSIAADLPGAAVLDLYAGSGSLGLEALSRGADQAVFVEQDRSAVEVLAENVDAVGLGGTIRRSDVGSYVKSGRIGPFDVVFLDPPYDEELDNVLVVMAALVDCVNDDALLVLHRRVGEDPPVTAGWALEGDRAYGTAQIWRFRRVEASDSQEIEENE